MGLLGKLFDKKECSVCGGEIGLLGNRKLEDGNLCKDCARKLSPFFSERRHSTVDEIKQQLAYREENEAQLANFNPTVVIGYSTKVYIDMDLKKFVVTRASSWRATNPDLIRFSQVNSCNIDIDEDKDEIFDKDKDGNEVSFNPPRYEYSYEFNIIIGVNSPYFDEIKFELSDECPNSRYTELYHQYEEDAHRLQAILLQQNTSVGNTGFGQNPVPQTKTIKCDKCGWAPEDSNTIPKFCPNCGDSITIDDIEIGR